MRLEYKYIVPISQIDVMRQQLLTYCELDPYSKKNDGNQYTVKSIYLDSKNLKDYYDKLEGVNRRKKVRIRGYNEVTENSKVFLELKKKIGSHVYKNRATIIYSELQNFLETRNIELITTKNLREDAEKFLYHYSRGSLSPMTLVTYEREAFFSKFDKTLRLTFDKNIRFKKADNLDALFSDDCYEVINNEFFVLEIKFATGFPDWLQKIIFSHKLTRKSFSKYAESIDEVIKLTRNSFLTDSKYRTLNV